MNVNTGFENLIKLLTLGDSGVGKTNFIFRFIENQFTETHVSTIGFDFKSQILTLPNKKVIKLQIWDTAGQERYMSVNKNLFLRVQGILLIYDISNRESFEHITNWISNIRELCANIPIILIGNKTDLDDIRVVATSEGQQIANEHNLEFLETSSKTGINVREAFINISEKVLAECNLKRSDGTSIQNKKKGYNNDSKCC
jgi:small GTP-binding protein